MRKLFYLWGVISALALTSCGNYIEEIDLEEDGSGTYQIYTDIIPATVEMTVSMTKMFATMDSTKTIDEDSLRTAMYDEVWADFPEHVDSVIDMAKELPDSIKNDPAAKPYIENMSGFMRGGKAEGHLYAGVQYEFKSIADLQGFLNFMDKTQEARSAQEARSPFGQLTKVRSKVVYKLQKNEFTRKVTFSQDMTDESESTEEMEALFGKGTMTTIIRTDRKIVTARGVNVQQNGDYEVVIKHDFYEAFLGKVNLDFAILFEKE